MLSTAADLEAALVNDFPPDVRKIVEAHFFDGESIFNIQRRYNLKHCDPGEFMIEAALAGVMFAMNETISRCSASLYAEELMAVDRKFIAEPKWTARCLNVVLRLRWFDREPTNQPSSVDWRDAALITAALFLNIHFWFSYGNELWMFCPILPYTFIVAAVAVLTTTLFFVAPAAITQATNLPLHRAAENAVGSVPAFGLRICTISFLVLWMANSIVVPALWWLNSILRRGVSTKEVWIIVAAIVAFVFFTGLQSTKTIAKLALFGNKLGIAILLAAIIRVHEGLPEAMNGFPHSDNPLPEFWRGLSLVMFYVAPLGFLAGNFGSLVQGRKQLAMTAVMGVVVPLFAVLMMIGVTNVATINSSFHQPSLNPNIPMALWGHAAYSSLRGGC
jgi:hypothetical protein